MRCWPIAICVALATSGVASAQVTGMAVPTPTVTATSPLTSVTGSPVSPEGIGLGATELPSPGISPAPATTGSIAVPSAGTACTSLGTSPAGMYGSSSTYDGGGMSADSSSGMSATSGMSMTSGMAQSSGTTASSGMLDTAGMSGMCGSGSSSIAASSSPTSTSPTAPGAGARTGIPLGSTEISNLGVSSDALVPTQGVLPVTAPATTGCSSTQTSTALTTPGGC
ncbi:hypothetical protein [Bradyrhizobium genosp. P]|uniref:hypothetical protein n=1 Tax=Bradyrhizobium genosp. P TaxID=83641 RepID=UPI003CF7871B